MQLWHHHKFAYVSLKDGEDDREEYLKKIDKFVEKGEYDIFSKDKYHENEALNLIEW